MGMPAALPHRWTADDVRRIPEDGKRYECIDGELFVMPSPRRRHQRALGILHVRLVAYVEGEGFGWVWMAPSDLELDPHTLVQPDLRVEPLASALPPLAEEPVPLLAIEVLSPSTAHHDRHRKRRAYQRTCIPEYWIVDPDSRHVERWRPADVRPELVTDVLVWHPDGAREAFTLALPAFFDDVTRWD